MATQHTPTHRAHVGDWIDVRGIHGQTPRHGEIVELIGEDPHQRFRVRWDEQHESILYPADGVMIIPRRHRAHHGHHS